MEFDNSFDVPLSPAQAWSVLMDIPRIAPVHAGSGTDRSRRSAEFRRQDFGAAWPGGVGVCRARRRSTPSTRPITARASRRRAATPRAAAPPTPRQHFASSRRPQAPGDDPYRPDAVGRGGAIRPRCRHDPGDGGADHRSVRRQSARAARATAASAAGVHAGARRSRNRARRQQQRARTGAAAQAPVPPAAPAAPPPRPPSRSPAFR